MTDSSLQNLERNQAINLVENSCLDEKILIWMKKPVKHEAVRVIVESCVRRRVIFISSNTYYT